MSNAALESHGTVSNVANVFKRTLTGESIDSPTRINSKVSLSKAHTHNLPVHVTILLTAMIPALMAAVNVAMVALDLVLVTFKWDVMKSTMTLTKSAWIGALAFAGVSALYGLCSSILVVFLDPRSAGSGIPESKGYMNGNPMHGFWTFRGLVTRAVGVIFTVAAGFPVGREGPAVSIGGCIGYGVTYLLASPYVKKWVKLGTEEKDGNLSPALVVDEARFGYALRLGTVLGSCAGIATAFNAPIGGILYMFEEVGVSTWAPETTFKAFIGAVVSCLASQLLMKPLGQAAHALLIFDPDANPMEPGVNPIDWLFLAICSALLGLFSVVFAKMMANTWTIRKRNYERVGKAGGKCAVIVAKLGEAMLYAFICAMVFGLVPSVMPCVSNPSSGASSGASAVAGSGAGSSASAGRRLAGLSYRQYICDDGQHNDLATLFLSGAEGAVKHLFMKKGDGMSIPDLSIALVTYFLMATGMPGLQVPMGCFVPCMLIGALGGRLFGTACALIPGIQLAHPGVYAMAGSAAMLGGFTHMTLAIVALLVEAGKDLSLLPMLMLAISISHLVSTGITHHGYDEVLILKKGVPFLEASLPHELEDGSTALELMDEYPDEAILPNEADIAVVEAALALDGLDVFPVVDDEGVCLGTINRSRLTAAVSAHKPCASANQAATEVELTQTVIQNLARRPSWTGKVAVHRLMDRCPHTLLEDMPASRFYPFFAMGSMEHAAVVSKHGEFRGVMTRRNLVSAASHAHAADIVVKHTVSSESPSRKGGGSASPVLLGNIDVARADKVEKDLETGASV